jgi:hypothetical protein
MRDTQALKSAKKESEGETKDPVHMVRNGAIAASIWQRQSPSGHRRLTFMCLTTTSSLSAQA